jgi:hypothetical protein
MSDIGDTDDGFEEPVHPAHREHLVNHRVW